ncbi:MAG TPA: hypothetical protein VGR37_12980 [Longimicrobiaceae bacterium]|nr:hypothetical protein [Longimicrobiaceae bacterium]
MAREVEAVEDPGLSARVVARVPLLYEEGPDAELDRPAHVRAGSSLAWVGGNLAVVQDDANFVALVDPATLRARAVPLPAGHGGKRQFDDVRGTKAHKLDLEACVAVPGAEGDLLLAFGSGSSARRERVAVVEGLPGSAPTVALRDASALYRRLRERDDFAGSDLNVEGAVLLGGRLRLFGRGNGAPRGGLLPVDATCDLEWAALRAYLRDPEAAPPEPQEVVRYRLGEIDGLRLGFTDAAHGGGRLLYSAAAEDSPDATRDGRVAGSALGVFDAPDRVRWTPLRGPDGSPFTAKVEGLALASSGRAWVVVDSDDPAAPSELCEVELSGRW